MTVTADVWDRLADALEYPSFAPPAMQKRYVETFDLNPACSLDVGWHLFGDAPERGAFLSTLRDELARAGVDERGELPDHLPALLRLIPREEDAAASALAGRIAPAVVRLRDVLLAEGNPFADVLSTVAHMLDRRITSETDVSSLQHGVRPPRSAEPGAVVTGGQTPTIPMSPGLGGPGVRPHDPGEPGAPRPRGQTPEDAPEVRP